MFKKRCRPNKTCVNNAAPKLLKIIDSNGLKAKYIYINKYQLKQYLEKPNNIKKKAFKTKFSM